MPRVNRSGGIVIGFAGRFDQSGKGDDICRYGLTLSHLVFVPEMPIKTAYKTKYQHFLRCVGSMSFPPRSGG